MTDGYGEFIHNPKFSRLLDQLHRPMFTLLHDDGDWSSTQRTASVRELRLLVLLPFRCEDRPLLGRHLGIKLSHYAVIDLVTTLQHFSSAIRIPTSSHVWMTI